MVPYLEDVAIIGAGLAGCALALALSERHVPVAIYEARPEIFSLVPSGVVLTPNGSRILSWLGVHSRIEGRCYKARHNIIKDAEDRTVQKILTADEAKYGYCNYRLWRSILLDEMRQMLVERGVTVRYNSKFESLVSDDDSDGVHFLINGERRRCSILIGADGLHSRVRRLLAPNVEPEYAGKSYFLSHIPRDEVAWPYPDYGGNATIQDKPGALFFIAEDSAAKDLMIGKQLAWPKQSRESLAELQADRERMVAVYREDYDQWGSTARSIIDAVTAHKDTLYVWPAWRLPRMGRWYSASGRVILIGDGAHAIPASTGQGVNQALEDVYSLALLLTSPTPTNASSSQLLQDILASWQEMRQKRVDEIVSWTSAVTDIDRMSLEERNKALTDRDKAGTPRLTREDMSWLYKPDMDKQIEECRLGNA